MRSATANMTVARTEERPAEKGSSGLHCVGVSKGTEKERMSGQLCIGLTRKGVGQDPHRSCNKEGVAKGDVKTSKTKMESAVSPQR